MKRRPAKQAEVWPSESV